MKIHINSLNPILLEFVIKEALPKYENIWRSQGNSDIELYTKVFLTTIGAKLGLRGDILSKYPLLSMYVDNNNMLDLEDIRAVALETLREFKDKGKKVVIPKIHWELDEDDINKIYDIAKKYRVDETEVKENTNGDEN